MKLRTTLAVVLLAITVVIGGVVYGSFEFTKQNAIERGQQNVDETAVTVADQIETDLAERRDRVGFVASQPTASDFNRTARTIDPFLENSRFYAAQLLWANGTVADFRGDVTDAVKQSAVGSDLSDEPYIQGAIEGETTVSEPIEVADSGEYILVVSAPIFENETVIGVFSAAIKLNRFTVLRATEPLETSVQTVSVRAGGDLLSASTADFDTSTALSAVAPVESTGWTVTVRRDRASLESELQFMAIVQVASLWLVLMSIIGLGVWEYRVNLSQTDRLLSGFQAVRKGLYEHRLALKATDEWERISTGFNELTAGIKRREDAIKEREQRLEVLNRVLRHNLRNDMAVIINYADMLPELVDDPDVEMAADKITSMGRGLTKLGTKAGKIEQAFQSVEDGLTTVDLADVVDSTVADLRDDYPGVDVSVTMPETAEALALSTVAMAVENVCENAAEHNTNPEPAIDVRIEAVDGGAVATDAAVVADEAVTDGGETVADGEATAAADDRIRLTVADNGPTIPDQEINVLTTGRETALEHGSGLGLWLVYWLVEKSEGELVFEESELGGNAVSLVFRTPTGADASADESEATTEAST